MFVFFTKPHSQDANEILSAIKIAFIETDLRNLIVNVIFLVSDHPSGNTWLKNGLIKLFKDELPCAGFVWCFSH